MSQTERLLLANVADRGQLGDGLDLGELLGLAAVVQVVLELEGRVEVILDRPLVAARHDDQLTESGGDGLLHHVLDDRLVDDRKHLLRLGLRSREEPRTEARRREDALADVHAKTLLAERSKSGGHLEARRLGPRKAPRPPASTFSPDAGQFLPNLLTRSGASVRGRAEWVVLNSAEVPPLRIKPDKSGKAGPGDTHHARLRVSQSARIPRWTLNLNARGARDVVAEACPRASVLKAVLPHADTVGRSVRSVLRALDVHPVDLRVRRLRYAPCCAGPRCAGKFDCPRARPRAALAPASSFDIGEAVPARNPARASWLHAAMSPTVGTSA